MGVPFESAGVSIDDVILQQLRQVRNGHAIQRGANSSECGIGGREDSNIFCIGDSVIQRSMNNCANESSEVRCGSSFGNESWWRNEETIDDVQDAAFEGEILVRLSEMHDARLGRSRRKD